MARTGTRRLAVGTVPMENRRAVVVRLARRAEELGYDAFFVAEGWGHDATAVLAEIAVRTERLQLGSGVLNVWGRSAAGIAMAAATLCDISGGRFTLGLGSGSPALAQGWHGAAFVDPVARLEATVRQVRRLLDGERQDVVDGYPAPGLRLAVPTAARVPIGLAALGPRAVRLAGEVADSWMPFFLPRTALPEAVRRLRGAVDEDPEPSAPRRPAICPAVPLAVSADDERATLTADRWLTFYLTRMGPLYPQSLRRCGFGAEVDAIVAAQPAPPSMVAPQLLDEVTLCGSPERVLAGLEGWYAAGADMPCLVLPPGHDVDELEGMLGSLAGARTT